MHIKNIILHLHETNSSESKHSVYKRKSVCSFLVPHKPFHIFVLILTMDTKDKYPVHFIDEKQAERSQLIYLKSNNKLLVLG